MAVAPSMVSARLDEVVRWRGDHPAYHFRGRSMSYRELGRQVRKIASGLASNGVRPGDRVAVLTRNRPEYFVVSQAIWRAGAVLVPVNVLLSRDEVVHVLRDSEAACVVAGGDLAGLASTASAEVGGVLRVVLDSDAARHGDLTWGELLDSGDDRAPARAPRPDRLAIIAYTSGTTGFPKGAMLDDQHLADAMANVAAHLRLAESDNFLQVFPVHSVAPGLIGGWLTAWLGSECAVLERFDVAEIARVIESRRVACFAMVPTMLYDLLRFEFARDPDFSSVRYIQAGGAAVPDRIRTELARRWDIEMIKSYGSTECSYVSLDHPGVAAVPGASGQVLGHIRLDVRSPGGDVLARGEVGELCVGGAPAAPRPFRPVLGYWNDPVKSTEALAGGVFHTGDLGYVDEAGFVFVVDRLKDMIIRGGNNIYPAELERVLREDARVHDAYVVGVTDPRLGEVPKAYLVRGDAADCPTGDATASDLTAPDLVVRDIVARANATLGRHKQIAEAEFIDPADLPRNAMNKVLKRELAARANASRR
jgi:acyl-CoA synthetase (AMP-forming)/AMP-acid ligase II